MTTVRAVYLFLLAVGMCLGLFTTGANSAPHRRPGDAAALSGIEKLHQQDVAATLAHDPQALAELFTEDAVLLEPESAPLIGRPAILAANKKDQAAHPATKVISYKPEIKDLQVVDGLAYEWDYFDASFKESDRAATQSFRGKALRILKREPDGSWKFARVMWNLAEGQNLPK